MYKNQDILQQQQHQQTAHMSITVSSSRTLFRLSYLLQRLEKQSYQDKRHHHSHHYSQRHRQKLKVTSYFSRCGLAFLIFLSAIKDSLSATHSNSYLMSLDVTTTTPQTNFLPYFDFDVTRNVTVTVGQTGFLHCRVERLGDKDVSWIRKRDLHILTAGSTTYTSDQRFQVLRPENSGNWTLQIKYPQPRDSGIYECQINTEPKMSLSYTFTVVELKATIIGPTDLYVKSGSDINLTCRIIQGPHELGNIFWYRGSEIIDMTTNQNEIDSGTRITVESDWSDGLTSRLKIRRASSSDTGNYTCVPTIAKSSSVYVHVIIGEHPAAMQHNASSTHCGSFYTSLCCMLFIILTYTLQHLVCRGNSNRSRKRTTTIATPLTTKETSTSIESLSMSGATVSLHSASLSLSQSLSLSSSSSPSPTTSTSKTKPSIQHTHVVTKLSQSKSHILSLASYIRTKAFPLSTSFNLRTTTAVATSSPATVTTATRLLVSNGKISR